MTRRSSGDTSGQLATPFTSSLEETFSPAPLHPRNILWHAFVDTVTDVVETSVSSASTSLLPVLKISDFEKSVYRENVLRADRPAQTARLTNPDPVQNCAI